MGVSNSPDVDRDEDWSPPADVVKLIAKHAAQLLIPRLEPPSPQVSQSGLEELQVEELQDEDELQMPQVSPQINPFEMTKMQSSPLQMTQMYSSPIQMTQSLSSPLQQQASSSKTLNAGSSSTSLGRSWKADGKDAQMFTSKSQSTVVTNTPEDDDMTAAFSASGGVRSRSNSQPTAHCRYSIRKVHTSILDPEWKKHHREPWDNSLRVPQDLYNPATSSLCSCQTPFDDGAFFCKRCGERRPLEPPPAVPSDVPKVISVINQDQNCIDRQYEWSGLYAQRLYRMQVQRYEDEEAYQSEEWFSPRTNPNSRRIAYSKETVPLMERVDDILTSKESKLEQKRKKNAEAVEKKMQEAPTIHPKSAKMRRNLTSLYRWEIARTRSVESRQDSQRRREDTECTFKPSISRASNRITQEYMEVSVHDRLIKDATRRQCEFDAHSGKYTPLTTEFEKFRSKSATPSTTAPSSPRSGSKSSKEGRSLSPAPSPQRGKKDDSWRGRVDVQHNKSIQSWQRKAKGNDDAMNQQPRASCCVLRPTSVDTAEMDKMRRLRKSRAVNRSPSSASSSPKRRSFDPRNGRKGPMSARQRMEADKNDPYTGGANRVMYKPDFHVALKIAHGSFDFWEETR